MKRLLLLAAGAILLSCAMAMTASAQDRCKGEMVKAAGKATIWGDKRAKRLAIDNWQREVRQKYGEQFMDFTKARQGEVDCGSSGIGVVGSRMKRCNVTGYPCHEVSKEDDEEADKGWGGNEDRKVISIQRRLVRAGYLERDDVDGEYGPKTTQAVRRFQRENDLRVTGKVDDRTWEKLRLFKRS
jgi:Putative peptidoglycan binding domain